MIKHRFILRDVSDFKVFAAIPVESSLLQWKRWQRPPDWEVLRTIITDAIELFASIEAVHRENADNYRIAGEVDLSLWPHVDPKLRKAGLSAAEIADFHARGEKEERENKELTMRNAEMSQQNAAHVAAVIEEARRMLLAPATEFDAVCAVLIEHLDPHLVSDTIARIEHWRDNAAGYARMLKQAQKFISVDRAVAALGRIVAGESRLRASYERFPSFQPRVATLLSSDPLSTTPCPVGLPFAAYTVEFDDVVVSVVEGCAWVSSRPLPPVSKEEQAEVARQARRDILKLQAEADATGERKTGQILVERNAQRKALQANPAPATPDERRVVEIVSQMLCERSLNPKADTRIPVREIDPAKAHQTREAERRDTAKGSATIRTIKFEVTPPRYLREAAEHILSNPRKAHWVIGHWRNQPYGEKRTLHKQLWIKPHIRGLGEASGTTTRVVAPRPEHPA